MGTIACSRILDRAAKTLLDETGVQWAPSELLDHLNSGINWIVTNKPDEGAVNASFQLAANETKQTIPAAGFQFLDVVRNMGANGSTIGRAIYACRRTDLDHANADWHTVSAAAIQHFMHDTRDPRVFYVYPRPTSALYVQLVYAGVPATVGTAATTLPIADIYENPLHLWIVAHAYAKNSKRGDVSKWQAYLTMAANMIGAKTQVQIVMDQSTVQAQDDMADGARDGVRT